jgi:outer membrane protein OmpA-like peptidoglycan-associated protein
MASRWLWVPLIAFVAVGCTSMVVLNEQDPLLVSASPPPPPPPPPPPKPERVEVQKEKIQVNEKIHFEFDSAKIREESHNLVDEIARVINEHPEIVKLRVEGHTDPRGTSKYNLDLSQRRAQAVADYLINQGSVDTARLEVQGYGFDQPIASNDTEEGMAKNRRVEFTILERDESKATPAAPAAAAPTAGGEVTQQSAGGKQ